MGCDDTSKVCSHTGTTDEYFNSSIAGFLGVVCSLLWLSVRRTNPDLKRYVKLGKNFAGFFHHRDIAIASHQYANQRFFHMAELLFEGS